MLQQTAIQVTTGKRGHLIYSGSLHHRRSKNPKWDGPIWPHMHVSKPKQRWRATAVLCTAAAAPTVAIIEAYSQLVAHKVVLLLRLPYPIKILRVIFDPIHLSFSLASRTLKRRLLSVTPALMKRDKSVCISLPSPSTASTTVCAQLTSIALHSNVVLLLPQNPPYLSACSSPPQNACSHVLDLLLGGRTIRNT